MATTSNALRTARPASLKESRKQFSQPRDHFERLGPQSVALRDANDSERTSLQLYTEQQVAEILQLSRSKLRKWRMGWDRGRREGPPFKKIGRLVRYSALGLRAYIDGR
jgi:Helix-turn-helix domain